MPTEKEFTDLLEEIRPKMIRYMNSMKPEDGASVMSNVMLNMWRNREKFTSTGQEDLKKQFFLWSTRFIKYALLNARRRPKKTVVIQEETDESLSVISPDKREEIFEVLEMLIATLPQKAQEIVVQVMDGGHIQDLVKKGESKKTYWNIWSKTKRKIQSDLYSLGYVR